MTPTPYCSLILCCLALLSPSLGFPLPGIQSPGRIQRRWIQRDRSPVDDLYGGPLSEDDIMRGDPDLLDRANSLGGYKGQVRSGGQLRSRLRVRKPVIFSKVMFDQGAPQPLPDLPFSLAPENQELPSLFAPNYLGQPGSGPSSQGPLSFNGEGDGFHSQGLVNEDGEIPSLASRLFGGQRMSSRKPWDLPTPPVGRSRYGLGLPRDNIRVPENTEVEDLKRRLSVKLTLKVLSQLMSEKMNSKGLGRAGGF